jgi:hypothetical protein
MTQKGPQTLKSLGQQLVLDHQKRLAATGSVPRSLFQSGMNADKQLLSLTAAGADMTHLNQLLAKYKVLSKELASKKVSALQERAGGENSHRRNWLNSSNSLDVKERVSTASRSDTIQSCASWPVAAPQCHGITSSQDPGTKGFGLSSVISMSRSRAEGNVAICTEEQLKSHDSSPVPYQTGNRSFGLSALLRLQNSLSNQTGDTLTTKLNESAVT